LIIDPNAHRRGALCQAIQNSLYSCISANDIETADYSGVEGVLLSTDAPDTLNTIRAQLHDAKCPILILYPPNDVYDRADYFRAGAADVVEATCDLRESSIIGLNAAVTDPLTGLYNRRYAQSHINLLLEDARSNGGSVTALMVDIDHFKSINDAHGHFVGDQVICSVAHTLKSAIRASDLVARFGGEEFVVILPNISPKDANTLAQRLRRKVSEITTDTTPIAITISIGISRFATAEPFESGLEHYD